MALKDRLKNVNIIRNIENQKKKLVSLRALCYDEITNRAFMRQYFAPDNDFLMYTTAVAAPPQTLLRSYGYKQA